MAEVNMLMLGGSGAGKTCFLLGMYEEMRFGLDGFSFSALDPDVDRIFSAWWEGIERRDGVRDWPLSTDERADFEFSFNYALSRLMTFTWTDYPGSALYTGELRVLRDGLQELLADCQGVLICLPGAQLFDFLLYGRSALKALNVNDVNQMLSEQQAQGAAQPAISVVVTKYDEFLLRACRQRHDAALLRRLQRAEVEIPEAALADDEWALHLMERAVRQAINTLFAKGGGWNVLICPVTLGMHLAEEAEAGPSDTRVAAPIEVLDMHLPVMFTFLEHSRRVLCAWEEVRAARGGEVERLESQLLRMFKKSDRREARAALSEANERLKVIGARAAVVEERFPSDAIVYRDGRRISGPQGA
jgi:hypothetical protein